MPLLVAGSFSTEIVFPTTSMRITHMPPVKKKEESPENNGRRKRKDDGGPAQMTMPAHLEKWYREKDPMHRKGTYYGREWLNAIPILFPDGKIPEVYIPTSEVFREVEYEPDDEKATSDYDETSPPFWERVRLQLLNDGLRIIGFPSGEACEATATNMCPIERVIRHFVGGERPKNLKGREIIFVRFIRDATGWEGNVPVADEHREIVEKIAQYEKAQGSF